MQLIFEQITYGVGSNVVLLGHHWLLLLVGLVLKASLHGGYSRIPYILGRILLLKLSHHLLVLDVLSELGRHC
jgi:hypothetical protein